ncbi:MAG: dihydropteroate synthase [Actinomycetota bacterium]|nr:dihydropteroate synthase [Actinomycetota bacterium]
MTTGDPMIVWRAGSHVLECGPRTLVMGVLNVTPDSFSDGGRFFDHEVAVSAGMDMVRNGADIIDVGGESTRPGSNPVPDAEQLQRVLPVIKRLSAEIDVPISIDTRSARVAGAAVEGGATIVNDVTAGSDPEMFRTVRESEAGMVLMHMRGEPNTMQQLTDYEDVVIEVKEYLRVRMAAAVEAGIETERLTVDPGLGFAKTTPQSLLLMNDIASFADLGRPVVVGPSRKSFIGDVLQTDVTERLEGTVGAVAWLVANGAHIVRVHDVKTVVRVVRVVDAIRNSRRQNAPSADPELAHD